MSMEDDDMSDQEVVSFNGTDCMPDIYSLLFFSGTFKPFSCYLLA